MEDYFVHPSALVDVGAKIGRGTKIWHFSHICGDRVEIGEDCSFGQNTYVGNQVKIGSGCRIQNNVSLYDCVELENDVFCGPSCVFTNVINPRAHVPRKNEFKRTLLRRGCSIGANATILCGIEIGQFALIAAGAIVTKNVPDFALFLGAPARLSGWYCACGERLLVDGGGPTHHCGVCGSLYKIFSLKGEIHVSPMKWGDVSWAERFPLADLSE